jgi:hypothetical protein
MVQPTKQIRDWKKVDVHLCIIYKRGANVPLKSEDTNDGELV